MSPERLAVLRRVAEAATPGPWHEFHEHFETMGDLVESVGIALGRGGTRLDGVLVGMTQAEAAEAAGSVEAGEYAGIVTASLSGNGPNSPNNARHQATFDPPTVLALLDEIEQLRQELEVLKPVYDEARMGSCSDCDQAMREAPMRDEDEVLGPCDVCEEMYAAVEKAEAYYWQREQEGSVGA